MNNFKTDYKLIQLKPEEYIFVSIKTFSFIYYSDLLLKLINTYTTLKYEIQYKTIKMNIYIFFCDNFY